MSMDIDDKIRKQKLDGKNNVYWSNEEWEELRKFFIANAPCKHSWFCLGCLSDEDISQYTNKNFKEGMTYMGLRHFKRLTKKSLKGKH